MYRLSRVSVKTTHPEIVKESDDLEGLIALKEEGEEGRDNPYIYIMEELIEGKWEYFSVYEYWEKINIKKDTRKRS